MDSWVHIPPLYFFNLPASHGGVRPRADNTRTLRGRQIRKYPRNVLIQNILIVVVVQLQSFPDRIRQLPRLYIAQSHQIPLRQNQNRTVKTATTKKQNDIYLNLFTQNQ